MIGQCWHLISCFALCTLRSNARKNQSKTTKAINQKGTKSALIHYNIWLYTVALFITNSVFSPFWFWCSFFPILVVANANYCAFSGRCTLFNNGVFLGVSQIILTWHLQVLMHFFYLFFLAASSGVSFSQLTNRWQNFSLRN